MAFLRGRYWDRCCLTYLLATWTVGSRAPSASLQMTPSWVVWSTHLRDRMPSPGTWTGLRHGPTSSSWGSTRPSAGSCTRVGAIPSTNTGWGMKGLRAALPRRTLGYWWMKHWTWANNVHLQPRKPTIYWAPWNKAWPTGYGRWFCPCTALCWESQNHRMLGVGRDLCGSSSPTLLPKQGHLEKAAQDLVHVGLEYLQRRRIHNLPGQPVPGLCHPQSQEVLLHVQVEFPMFQFVPVAPCPVTGHHWKESGPILLTPTIKIFINISKVPSQASFLQPKQASSLSLSL